MDSNIMNNKEHRIHDFLKECKKIYDLKYRDHLSTKEISNRLNLSKTSIYYKLKEYKIYLLMNKNINKYMNLIEEDKKKLYQQLFIKSKEKYLKECKELYDLRYLNNLSIKEINNLYDIPVRTIYQKIKNYKTYLDLDKDIYKYLDLDNDEEKETSIVSRFINCIINFFKKIFI